MDYYEELGIPASATLDEIHKAHRRLSKLFHPDQQNDDTMKVLAETQMRRLNAIVAILCDPELRDQYDRQLRGTAFSTAAARIRNVSGTDDLKPFPFQKPGQRLLLWWAWIPLLAIVITGGAVWFWANSSGASFDNGGEKNAHAITGRTTASRKRATSLKHPISEPAQKADGLRSPIRNSIAAPISARDDITKLPDATASLGPKSDGVPKSQFPKAREGQAKARKNAESTLAALADTPTLFLPLSRAQNEIAPPPPPSIAVTEVRPEMPPMLLPLPVAPATIVTTPAGAGHGNPLAGEWVYVSKEPETQKPGFYPPESIDLKLFLSEGLLRGQYKARYHVSDQPVSPDVDLLLLPADRKSQKFIWESANGSRGRLKIRPMDSNTIRVEWRTTVYSTQRALTAGTATLVRRSP